MPLPGVCPVGIANCRIIGNFAMKMKEKSLLLKFIGVNPLFCIVDFLLENKGVDFSKAEIAKGAGISRASLFNHWPDIENNGLVRITRRFGKTKLYVLNVRSPVAQKIVDLEKALITVSIERASARKKIVTAEI
jgi:hypothetical protein